MQKTQVILVLFNFRFHICLCILVCIYHVTLFARLLVVIFHKFIITSVRIMKCYALQLIELQRVELLLLTMR